ncbi:MAG: shikimate kinase [Clostridia bacterium]|nr:shikimate kinase [Clostridia bacterium]
MKTGHEKMRCGLIGEHLGHSFSKIIHAKITDYSYDLVELPPEGVGDFVKNGGYDAFNVTIPYKKTVMPFLDRISPEAERIGAVNTVVRRPDGSIDGYNTDYFGFDGMLTSLGIDVKGKKAVVLGNGGASLTVQCVLADRGVRETVVVDLGLENNYDNIDKHFDAEIIVNATPVGMYPKNGQRLVNVADFKNCIGVLDVIYNPAKTALLLEAEKLGIPHINGLYMLVAQAVKAYEFFTGDIAEKGIIEKITADISYDTKNIIMIGMPGCGKSTVGKRIAGTEGRPFFDADDEFTKMYGVTPAETITSQGEDKFREMEHEVLEKLGKESGTVIACGGGVITREYNYAPLHQNGTIVYLRRELSRLETNGRPLSQSRPVEELYAARREGYERFADLTVDSTEVPDATAMIILEMLKRG